MIRGHVSSLFSSKHDLPAHPRIEVPRAFLETLLTVSALEPHCQVKGLGQFVHKGDVALYNLFVLPVPLVPDDAGRPTIELVMKPRFEAEAFHQLDIELCGQKMVEIGDVKLFYEVYGGEPPYRIAYSLEGKDLDGSWIALGQPSTGEQSAATQAWELSISTLGHLCRVSRRYWAVIS